MIIWGNVINKKKRLTTLVILLCFIFVSTFSEAFVLIYANHSHDYRYNGSCHEDKRDFSYSVCDTCLYINKLGNLLRQLRMPAFNALFMLVSIILLVTFLRSLSCRFYFETPVGLKIRMNN